MVFVLMNNTDTTNQDTNAYLECFISKIYIFYYKRMERYNYEQDESYIKRLWEYIKKLEEENRKLREFKEKREESMFYFKAQMERVEPKTAMDAEKLQKGKEIFEKIMLRRLHLLEEENKELKKENELLKECNIRNYTSRSDTDDMNLKLLEENKNLKKENRRLNEVYEVCNIDSINKTFKVANLEMENEKLKEELEWYKKQYEHSMGED